MSEGGARADDLVAGTVLADRYRIEGMLGRGGMGVVYRGEHLTVGRPVAVKVLAAEWIEHGDVSRRFRAEARAASAAGHPNIIEVLDAGELPDGRPYLVTELIAGRDLYQLLVDDGPLAVDRACHIGVAIARALDAAHAEGIVHRDLKLENVMVARHGEEETVKVLDFGIAADTADPGRRRTAVGKVLGTPGTMAPEQAAGARATPAFDIYALGVVLHEILAGHGPFEGETGQAMMAAKLDADAPSIAEQRAGLPESLVAIVDQCLARDPERRPSSAGEVARHLQAILRRLESGSMARDTTAGTVPVPLLAPAVGEGPSSRRRGWLPWVALGALLVAGAGAWAAVPGDAEPSEAATRDEPARGDEPRTGDRIEPSVVPPVAVPGVVPDDAPQLAPSEPARSEAEPAEPESIEAGPSDPEAGPVEAGPNEPEPAEPTASPSELPVAAPASPTSAQTKPTRAKPSVTPTTSPADCQRMRKQARQAREDSDWAGILRHTDLRGCWTSASSERLRLRTKAFMELGRWSQCIAAGRGLTGSEPESWVRLCERRRERG
ncbi:MAG: protein kinase [Myxococcales bacterium]|nr:protein kinase [Myxococcales bacterium]